MIRHKPKIKTENKIRSVTTQAMIHEYSSPLSIMQQQYSV